ncbi:MAG: hypothetical protein K6F09_05805 [Clostridiales bacterium]|nr:hypothetical protein [Clostridiales bacterium]
MSIEDTLTKILKKVNIRHGKKLLKNNGKAPEIPDEEPVFMKNKTDEFFNVGFAKRITMPDDINAKQYWVAGYKSGNLAKGVLDPMTVSAMWIDCKDNGGIVLVSADCIGLTGFEVAKIRDSLSDFKKESGCKLISISCTHTHGGIDTVGYWGKPIVGPLPGDGKDPEFMALLMGAIKDVCIEAYKNKKEGKLYIGSTHVPGAQFDKRPPLVLNDTLTRIRFVPNDGGVETWFLNFAAHPNTMGGDNDKITADYPYYMRETINKTKETNVLFSAGAICAVDPGNYCEDKLQRTIIEGETLGNAALKIDNDVQMKPEITVLNQKYYAPIDNCVLGLMSIVKTVNSLKFPYDKGELGLALRTEMTYIKIGNRQILVLPGEAMQEFVYGGYAPKEESATGLGPEINPTPLSEIAGDKDLIVFGVSNDMTGYMVPPNDFVLHKTQGYLNNGRDVFDRSHYHETNSLGYLTTQTIADVFAGIIDRVRKAENAQNN